MLGLGTTLASIDSGQIYKELSELDNYADLDIHFDFSTLTGAHGATVTAATNLGAGGATNNINANDGTPLVDTTTLNKKSVAFDGTNDILSLASAYTTTSKACTFFMVFYKTDTTNDIFVQKANNNSDDMFKISGASNKTLIVAYAGDDTVSIVMNATDSTTSWVMPVNVPVVLVIARNPSGNVYVYAMRDGDLVASKTTATMQEGASFTLGAIGGSTATTQDWTGNIAEFGMYDAMLDSPKIKTLCRELSTKWGIGYV